MTPKTIHDLETIDGYTVGVAFFDDAGVVYTVSGPGFSGLMVRVDADTGEATDANGDDLLTALCDPAGQEERAYQLLHGHPSDPPEPQ